MKLLKIFIFSFLILIGTTLVFPKEFSLFSINLYQKYVSPRKGYHCAYAIWHNDISCSAYGEQIIAEEGFWRGIYLLYNKRFPLCKIAATKIDSVKKQKDCRCCSGNCCEDSDNNCCGNFCTKSYYGEAYRDSLAVKDSIVAVEDSLIFERNAKTKKECAKCCNNCGGSFKSMIDSFVGCCTESGSGPGNILRQLIPPGTN